ncbi:MAG TPA: molybdopterin-dependent oxidoreductase [Rhodothermales bacterium]|nr:molybdopterin-dependent oxidoreductase [Rhodothermales bacterium]
MEAPPYDPAPKPGLVGEPAELAEEEFRRRTRRSFLVGGSAALAGALGWRWLRHTEQEARLAWPVRDGLEANEGLWRTLHRPSARAATFPVSRARIPRVNGRVGLDPPLDAAAWRLSVEGPDRQVVGTYTLDGVKALPRHELVTELKCVEGWSEVVHWTGARFSDFVAAIAETIPARLFRYVSLRTPDEAYFVALTRAQAMHAQTLLCYEMQGAPLTPPHGAPLRLVIPGAYGVKHLKRIGTIRFAMDRPNDYWALRGYDWYLGH